MRDYAPLPDNIFTPTENDIPNSLSEEDVFVFLNSVEPEKSGGPDSLPNWGLAEICSNPSETYINNY